MLSSRLYRKSTIAILNCMKSFKKHARSLTPLLLESDFKVRTHKMAFFMGMNRPRDDDSVSLNPLLVMILIWVVLSGRRVVLTVNENKLTLQVEK